MKTKYINYGIGFRIKDTIYLNSALKHHPELHKAILTHEKNHSDGFILKDFLMDLSNKEIRKVKWQYYKFILTHPKSLAMFLPIMKVDGNWTIDITLSLFYLAIGGLVWFLISMCSSLG